MSKEFKEGYIFEVVGGDEAVFSIGSIVVLSRDDGSSNPLFDLVKGSCSFDNGEKTELGGYLTKSYVRRLWPKEEKETVELNGEKYLKSDLEEALKHLKPVGE